MKRRFILFSLMLLLVVPSVLADIRPPSPGETAVVWLVLLMFNYIVNFILIGIQSRIWLHLGFKKIAAGLAIATPIMFILEGVIVWFIPFYPNGIALLSAILIGLIICTTYYLTAIYFWELEKNKALITALIMAILTNPGVIWNMSTLWELIYFNTPSTDPNATFA